MGCIVWVFMKKVKTTKPTEQRFKAVFCRFLFAGTAMDFLGERHSCAIPKTAGYNQN